MLATILLPFIATAEAFALHGWPALSPRVLQHVRVPSKPVPVGRLPSGGRGRPAQVCALAGVDDQRSSNAERSLRGIHCTDEVWQEFIDELRAFAAANGHTRVPITYATDAGYELGRGVAAVRAIGRFRVTKNRPERVADLSAVGFVWNAHDHAYTNFLGELAAFKEREGHACVPVAHVAKSGFRLGQAVCQVRRGHFISNRPQRRAELDSLGFVWVPHDSAWHTFLSELKAYKRRHGDTRVPQAYVTSSGYRLGTAVKRVRTMNQLIHDKPQRRTTLDKLGFIWDLEEDAWRTFVAELHAFKEREGHVRVPQIYTTRSGYKLGKIVSRVRTSRKFVDGKEDRVTLLDGLGFVWKCERVSKGGS